MRRCVDCHNCRVGGRLEWDPEEERWVQMEPEHVDHFRCRKGMWVRKNGEEKTYIVHKFYRISPEQLSEFWWKSYPFDDRFVENRIAKTCEFYEADEG